MTPPVRTLAGIGLLLLACGGECAARVVAGLTVEYSIVGLPATFTAAFCVPR